MKLNFNISTLITPLLLVLLFQQDVRAQEYLIRQFPGLDTIPATYGPNRKHYAAVFYGFGALFGPTDSSGSNILPERSYWLTLGFRHKKKHSSFFNTGTDFFIEARNFSLAQTDKKVFGGTFLHRKERLHQYTVNLSLFMRFNLVKRGDHLGKYIDLYATGIYAPITRHYTYDKIDPLYGSKNGKHTFSQLQYTRRIFAQVGLRLGISFLQFQFFYRPVNMLKRTKDFPYPELPRFGAGIILDVERIKNK